MGAAESKGYTDCNWRLVLVGKTGVGKSATGNTILGQEVFESKLSSSSLTKKCEKGGQQIAVIDTPGLFDTKMSLEETAERINKCISLSSPGPHAFLICIQIGRFTKEEKETVQLIQKIFGKEAADYTMVLFTHGDKLKEKSIESFIEENEDLSELIKKCRNRYHVFNNQITNEEQTNTFMEKIHEMVQMNGGGYYTNDTFKSAEEAIEKEKERLLKLERCKKKLEKFAKFAKDLEEGNVIERLLNEARVKAEMFNEFVTADPAEIVMKIANLAGAGDEAAEQVGEVVGAVSEGLVEGLKECEICVIQ